MSEIFFESLTERQWLRVAEYVSHCLPICLTDRESLQTLTEFIHLVNQFCEEEEGIDADE